MAKEVIQGEVVEILDDDGPEEGEIEDDTSEEEIIEKNEFHPSNTTDVNTTAVGLKYYQKASGSSKTEIRNGKSKVYSEDKKEPWRTSSRRHYKFYVDHDKPTRDTYDRSIKSDLTNDHRGINFHELLKDYKTSKHGNEGNSHEKENRHFAKEARVDSSRKRDSGLSDTQEDKVKRNRKRKHHRSPSHSPVSSDSDVVRKRKDSKTVKQKKKKKLAVSIRNLKESAALFAQIRAKRNSAIAAELQKSKVEIINVPSEGENVTEVSEKCISSVRGTVSEGDDGKSDETRTNAIGGFPLKDSTKNDSSKSLCSASDSQNAEKVEDSESKDEDDDENQLRMIALQSAFRAKFLERKRRGFIVRKQTRRTMSHISPRETNSDAGFNLDDTADMLEAAVEEAVACCTNKEALDFSEAWQPSFSTSLSEVPLPPDDPPLQSPVEDLTPVDMDLALTDEEENTDTCQLDENGFPSENLELSYPKIRLSHSSLKTRNIPVTIGGRIPPFKSRQRMGSCVDNTRRSNLLEVRTYSSEGLSVDDLDSCLVGMAGVDMGQMIVLDAVGTCSSPEAGQGVEDDVLSEASDAKGDFTQPQSNQGCLPENDIDDEDEELLRARLLLDISSRHRSENLASNSLKVEDVKECSSDTIPTPFCKLVSFAHDTTVEPKTTIKINGKNSIAHVAALQSVKVKASSKRNIERARRGQLLAKARGRQAILSSNGQIMVSPFMKSYLSKISNRGKFQRVNQSRMAVGKKRIDSNLQVTVLGSGGKTKAVSKIPQQQDRIVICLGDDSDESEDEKQNVLTKTDPVISKATHLPENQTSASAALVEVLAVNNVTNAPEKSTPGFPAPNVSIDFEKSVDLFLKEVRSGQESKSKAQPVLRESHLKKMFITPKQTLSAVPRIAGNGPKTKPAKLVAKSASGVTPQAVRHLPALQQEEYRRLKMQISVLEEKKRKAAEILQGSSKGGNVAIKQKVGPAAPDTTIKTANISGSSSLSKAKKCDVKVSSEGLQEMKENAKIVDSGSDRGNGRVTEEIDDEDVNLMREQLLKSTLHKKINAKSENSSLRREVLPVVREEIPHSSCVISNSEEVPFGKETTALKENVVPSKKETQPSDVAILPSEAEDTVKMDKAGPSEKVAAKTRQIPTIRIFNSEEVVSASNKCDHPSKKTVDLPVQSDQDKAEGGVPKRGAFLKAQEILVSRKCLNVTECAHQGTNTNESKVEVCDSLSKNADAELGSISLLRISREMDPNRGKEAVKGGDTKSCTSVAVKKVEVQDVGVQALAISPRSTDSAKNACSASTPVFQENQDMRASELMELEYKLLSERHAALKYLSELSSLLTKMEIEGARLRQKEIAAQKLRAELAAAETSISTQKDYLKQLAQNISSTHERVSTTRQRCSVLSHACMILGNQIKKDKRVNGVQEAGGYCVPTGGAALVKSQLSSVHVKTKQLKKAGLPFLRGQNFNTRVKYPIQKGPVKQPGNSPGQSSVVSWTNPVAQSLECLKLNPVEKPRPMIVPTSLGIPEVFRGTVTSLPGPKSALVLKTTSKSKTDCSQSVNVSHVRKTVPVSRSVLTPGKFVHSSSSTLSTRTVSSSYTSKSSAKGEVSGVSVNKLITKVSENVVQTVPETPSSLLKDFECSGPKSVGDVSSVEQVVTSDAEKLTTSSESVMKESMPLKIYHSPLEPISARSHLEDLAVTSESSMLLEDSVMLDPNIILCPYDLMGECQDEECTYQHQRRKRYHC